MAEVGTENVKSSPLGGLHYKIYTATNVQTDGTSTVGTDFRTIRFVGYQNTANAGSGGLKITTSGSTITLTAETSNDDFELFVAGV